MIKSIRERADLSMLFIQDPFVRVAIVYNYAVGIVLYVPYLPSGHRWHSKPTVPLSPGLLPASLSLLIKTHPLVSSGCVLAYYFVFSCIIGLL